MAVPIFSLAALLDSNAIHAAIPVVLANWMG